MTKAVIPWHVFHDAVETLDSCSLDPYLQRWRFMDNGVVLFDGYVAAPETPRAHSTNANQSITEEDVSEDKLSSSSEPVTSGNKSTLH